jgi:hypothetical protein
MAAANTFTRESVGRALPMPASVRAAAVGTQNLVREIPERTQAAPAKGVIPRLGGIVVHGHGICPAGGQAHQVLEGTAGERCSAKRLVETVDVRAMMPTMVDLDRPGGNRWRQGRVRLRQGRQ